MRVRDHAAVVRGGFTLMEMMVVVAIIVVLAGIAVPLVFRQLDDAKKDRARVDVRTLSGTVDMYFLKYSEYPPSLESLTQPTADGGRPFLEPSALLDPWMHPYQYANPGQHNAASGKPDIWSLGPNVTDPNGIIGNW